MNDQGIILPDPEYFRSTQEVHTSVLQCIRNPSTWAEARKQPNSVCSPAQDFVVRLTKHLFSLASPNTKTVSSPPELYDTLERALTDPNCFNSFLPYIGRFLLYFRVVRFFIQKGDESWLRESPPFEFKMSLSRQADVDWSFTSVEFHWIMYFLGLSHFLSEPDLDVIPGFFTNGTKDEIKSHAVWKKLHEALVKDSSMLPFRLKYCQETQDNYVVTVKSQGDHLYSRLIPLLALQEWKIRWFVEQTSEMWMRMRSSQGLAPEETDQSLMHRLLWQVGRWPTQLMSDPQLSTTAMRATIAGPWPDSEHREDVGKLHKRLVKIHKKASGYGPGNIGRTINDLDSHAEEEITKLAPDLARIRMEVWPLVRVGRSYDLEKAKEKAKSLNLEHVKPNHMNLIWREVKDNEPLDLCVKMAAEYLEDKTGRRYNLKAIKHLLKTLLSR